MDAEKVENYTRNLENFGGIFSLSQLKNVKILSLPVSLIINFNDHWIAIFISKDLMEVCDSIGYLKNNKLDRGLQNFLKTHLHDKHFFATPQLQSDTSYNCAMYAISYLYCRHVLKKTLCDFTGLFTNDFNLNFSIISELFHEIEKTLILDEN